MEFLYGYSVAADLQPECRYDQVVEALGGHGELVREPGRAAPALERAFASGKPALVNVLTDPVGGLPAQVEPGLVLRRTGEAEPPGLSRFAGGTRSVPLPDPRNETTRQSRAVPTAQSGRAGVRALKEPCGSDGGRRRYDAASPEPMYRAHMGRLQAATPDPAPSDSSRPSAPKGNPEVVQRLASPLLPFVQSVQRDAVEDVGLAYLGLAQPERLQRRDQDRRAGDDRGGAVGVQAGHPPAARPAASTPAGPACARSRPAPAGSRPPGPGRRAPAPGRWRPARWPCPPRRSRCAPGRARPRARSPAMISRAARPSASVSWCSGGSEARWRSDWRTDPRRVDTWKSGRPARQPDHELRAAAADVDHQHRLVAGVPGGGAEEGQPRLLLAGDDLELEARLGSRTRSRNSWPLSASRTALVATATDRARPPGVGDLPVPGQHVDHALHRVVGQPAAGVHALAQPRDLAAAARRLPPGRRR